jgi:hypothetical protein
MKKNLLVIALLALSFSADAQTVICSVNKDTTFYVGKNTLVYNGGGLQLKENGLYENHGNVMVVGNATTDVFTTVDAANANKVEGSTVVNFINKLNEPTAYNSTNSTDPAFAPVYTYGQLYISGLIQDNVLGIVDQEYRQASHGAYQQLAFPFYGKSASTLKNELGKTFTTVRRSQNEILRWDNPRVVFDNLPDLNFKFGQDEKPFKYYSLGGLGLDVSSVTRTLKGRPVADAVSAEKKITLSGAGAGVNFGVGTGNMNNQYGGKYNTYLQDGFEIANGGTAWQGNFGRNIYQFGNPYMTNLDLSKIGVAEAGGDGNNLTNIYGVRLEVSGVTYNPNSGGGTTVATSTKAITFVSGVAIGDVEYQVIRPMGTFEIKLKSNLAIPEDLDFSTLRRFNYHPRAGNAYTVTAAKGTGTSSTVKQLAVIGLDVNGNELERTYYVVSPETVSGNSTLVKGQIGAFDGKLLGTYEEDAINGGYDNNHVSYWLYLNEANETDFQGKNIKLVNYNSKIVGFRFEIRENGALVENGTQLLSQGIGFYYRKESESTVHPIVQNATVNTVPGNYQNGVEYNLYYGSPDIGVLGTGQDLKKSSTIVVYNSQNDNFVVLLDHKWNSADIQVYDMSGKLVHKASKVLSTVRYELPLQKISAGYIVHITSDKGEKVVTKILR